MVFDGIVVYRSVLLLCCRSVVVNGVRNNDETAIVLIIQTDAMMESDGENDRVGERGNYAQFNIHMRTCSIIYLIVLY